MCILTPCWMLPNNVWQSRDKKSIFRKTIIAIDLVVWYGVFINKSFVLAIPLSYAEVFYEV